MATLNLISHFILLTVYISLLYFLQLKLSNTLWLVMRTGAMKTVLRLRVITPVEEILPVPRSHGLVDNSFDG